VRKETNSLLVPNAALRWSAASARAITPEVRAKIQADPPGDSNTSKPASGETRGVVWLEDGDYARPVEVKVGATDGVNTAITSDTLQEGTQVVTGAFRRRHEGHGKPILPAVSRQVVKHALVSRNNPNGVARVAPERDAVPAHVSGHTSSASRRSSR